MAIPLCTTTRHVIWCLSAALFCLVLVEMINPADGQAYHFSKGWMPGRKRAAAVSAPLMATVNSHDAVDPGSGTSAALIDAIRRAVLGENKDLSSSATAVCAIRSQVYRLVIDMIKDGFERLDDVCELNTHASSSVAADLDARTNYLRHHASYEKSSDD